MKERIQVTQALLRELDKAMSECIEDDEDD